jgi:hypothetical protein
MRKNFFINLSNKEIQDCFNSYIRVQIKREKSEDGEMFAQYVDEYIWMLEREGNKYRYYDDNKKYNIAFSIAEKDMLYDMSKRYLKICGILNQIKPFFGEGMEVLD